MRIIGIDPGPTQSALVVLGENCVLGHGIEPNAKMLESIGDWAIMQQEGLDDVLVIERVANMGMPAIGESIFETVFWAGRFAQIWRDYSKKSFYRLKRHEVKSYLCGNQRAKDANIRQALIDRFGGKDKAIGRKGAYGPLAGIHGDCWQALAVAYTWQAQHAPTRRLTAPEATL